MDLVNIPLLYRKDDSGGHSSNPFLREEPHNKQKNIDNLLNIINYMHTNSNKSGEDFHKNTNADPVHINTKAEIT